MDLTGEQTIREGTIKTASLDKCLSHYCLNIISQGNSRHFFFYKLTLLAVPLVRASQGQTAFKKYTAFLLIGRLFRLKLTFLVLVEVRVL